MVGQSRGRFTLIPFLFSGLVLFPVIASGQDKVSFDRQIRSILSNNCYQCHGPDEKARQADLRLDLEQGVFADRDLATVKPGDRSGSELFQRISSEDADLQMPPPDSSKKLNKDQVELIGRWIDEGAEWESHWAWTAPQQVAVPQPRKSRWVVNDIDRFVLTRLRESGFKPSEEADRVTLVRRLSFDLIGLPPTPAEVDVFVHDDQPGAYQRLVDRLLKSPHYGERMAIYWLDVVRYADSNGYHADKPREISPYRDYVIRAFNENMPFDRFVVEQLAGDLLPDATDDQKIASGFNMLLQTTDEGGAQAKEYLAKYSSDRVRNTSSIFMGVTLGCAECHDHKFDPFTTRDFYQFAAFFADIKEVGVGNPTPYPVVTVEHEQRIKAIDEKVTQQQKLLETSTPELLKAQQAWEVEAIKATGGQPLLSSWQLIGPFTAASFDAAHTTAFPPETEIDFSKTYGELKWRSGEQLVDGKIHPLVGDNSASYLYRTIEVEQATRLKLFLGSDDSLQIWLNGKKVHENKVLRGVVLDQDKLTLELAAGENKLLMKIANGGGGYGFSFRSQASTIPQPIAAILKLDAGKRDEAQKNELATYFRTLAPQLKLVRDNLAALVEEKKQAMAQLPKTLMTVAVAPRMIRILPRGNWLDDSGPEVAPAIPGFLGGLEIESERANRLDLARWVISPDNPLTARAFTNRVWKLFFGHGLAQPLDDLGAQGSKPTHPELLDYLAIRFTESGWDVKQLVRSMVLSATYQQTSLVSERLAKQDPYNHLYARQSRFRLDAELVRDNALAVSGLLDLTIGGPSVKPYQPAGYWSHMNFPKRSWQQSGGENLYRRGLYTHWQRMFLHPSLLAFDAPSREECTVERPRSNTPQQALVLLNDPTYVEAARSLAVRVLNEAGETSEQRLSWLFQTVLSRSPQDSESSILRGVLEKHRQTYKEDVEAAKQFLGVGMRPIPEDLDVAELAAWTSITRIILNLHETITRN